MRRILVVNAGSSSLKLATLEMGGGEPRVAAARTVQRWDGGDPGTQLDDFLASNGRVDAIGHRFVHGGPDLVEPVLIDQEVLTNLGRAAELAPLHQYRALDAHRAMQIRLPGCPQVACFDTAFHATIPAAASTYALPSDWNARWRLRRYGFHGLSHSHAANRGAELIGASVSGLRIVTAHLGAGASLCAVRGGRSADTTMGFTPLAGLVMTTRSGSVDPGLLLWLLRHRGLAPDELEDVLEHRSGLAGLSGTSGDLRDVLGARDRGEAGAALAIEVFLHRLARETAAMTAALGGIDLLVFTGGIGEHSPEVRRRLVEGLPHLGLALDAERNEATHTDADVSAPDAVRVVVVTAREDLEIARHVDAVLGKSMS